MDPKTRQYIAAGAFALLLVAVVVLQFVPSETANSLSARLEGAMGMALAALLVETGVRAKAAPVAMLALVVGLMLVVAGIGCGGSSEETRPTACAVTEAACQACDAARDRWCGGPPVEVEDTAGGEQ